MRKADGPAHGPKRQERRATILGLLGLPPVQGSGTGMTAEWTKTPRPVGGVLAGSGTKLDSAEEPWFVEVDWGARARCTRELGITQEAAGEEEAKA